MPAKKDAEKEDVKQPISRCWAKDLKALAALQECKHKYMLLTSSVQRLHF